MKAVAKPKEFLLLCLCDYKATTGFATVSTNILGEMKRRFGASMKLDIIAINYFGEAFQEDENTRVIPLAENEAQNNALGMHSFLRRLNLGLYRGCFIIQDPGIPVAMMYNLQEVAANYHKAGKKRFRSLFYFPIDSVPLDFFFDRAKDRSLAFFDQLVTYTEYGRREILKKAPWLKDKLQVIAHGINVDDFYEMSPDEKRAFRLDYFGANADKIIVTNVNRNQFRKDIPTSLQSLRQFKEDHPDHPVFLYLHMHPHDEMMGWDLRLVASQLGLVEGEDYGFPAEADQNAGAVISRLRGIYNASDFYLTTTTGEGWGLGVTEAMACGLPVIGPNHTSLTEIGGQGTRMWMLEESYPYCDRWDGVWREQCSFQEVSERLYEALALGHVREQKRQAALEYAKKISWRRVCDRWEEIFRNLFLKRLNY